MNTDEAVRRFKEVHASPLKVGDCLGYGCHSHREQQKKGHNNGVRFWFSTVPVEKSSELMEVIYTDYIGHQDTKVYGAYLETESILMEDGTYLNLEFVRRKPSD